MMGEKQVYAVMGWDKTQEGVSETRYQKEKNACFVILWTNYFIGNCSVLLIMQCIERQQLIIKVLLNLFLTF